MSAQHGQSWRYLAADAAIAANSDIIAAAVVSLGGVQAVPVDGGLSQCQTSGLAMAAAAVKDTE
jgi:hypothetical protein